MSESKGIESDLIPRIATGFCSGISRTSGLCGAVSGGILALNIFFGRNTPEESVETIFGAVQTFVDKFEARFGMTNCGQLTGLDLATEEGRALFDEKNMIVQCREYVEEATAMVMRIIDVDESQR